MPNKLYITLTPIMNYSEQLTNITKDYNGPFAEEIRLTPKIFNLLNDLTLNTEIPEKFHADLYAAMGYFIAPYDIYPEDTFGPIGFIDDVLFSLIVLEKISHTTGREPLYDEWPNAVNTLDQLLDQSLHTIKNEFPSFNRKINKILNR